MEKTDLQDFEQLGYHLAINVLDAAGTAHYLAEYLAYQERRAGTLNALAPNEQFKVLSETHFVLPWVYELVSHPTILDVVEQLIGSDIIVWNTNWFTKMPGAKTYVSWHQDGTYWNFDRPNIVTAWLALAPSMPENGCMRVIPGTHTQIAMPQRETFAADNALSRGQEIAVEVDENAAVDLVLEPGQASLHHLWIVHGSNANTSDVPRIGLAIRYVAPEVGQKAGRPLGMLVRGEDRHGHFALLPPPTEDPGDQLEAVHTGLVDRIRASIMQVKNG